MEPIITEGLEHRIHHTRKPARSACLMQPSQKRSGFEALLVGPVSFLLSPASTMFRVEVSLAKLGVSKDPRALYPWIKSAVVGSFFKLSKEFSKFEHQDLPQSFL